MLSCMMLLFILIPNLVGQVYSQMPPGFQTPSTGGNPPMMPTTKMVTGKYVNPEFGLEITFPELEVVTETSPYIGPGTTLVSGIIGTMVDNVPVTSTMMVLLSDSSVAGSSNRTLVPANITAAETCKPLSSEMVNIGGKIAQASVTPCNTDAGALSKARNYYVDLGGGKSVSIVLLSPPYAYDSALVKFEETVKSIKFITPSAGQQSKLQPLQ